MKNEYLTFSKILESCLKLDKAAHSIYRKFAVEAHNNPELKKFWCTVAEEEHSHMKFWRQAISQCRQMRFPVLIDDVDAVSDRMVKIGESLNLLIRSFSGFGDAAEEIMLGYTIESYLFDPTFMMIFNSLKFIEPEINSSYEQHILRFIDIMRRFDQSTAPVKIEILGQTLYNLYMMNKQLAHDSSTDMLTGLFTRRGFFNSVIPSMNFAARNRQRVGIIMMDIDNFKKINDVHGHPVGDQTLTVVGELIRGGVRRSDIAGRYGGEEFIVFTGNATAKGLATLCERIRKNIDQRSEALSGIHFTVSVGAVLAKVTDKEESFLAFLIDRADQNLLRAKAQGKNCWVWE